MGGDWDWPEEHGDFGDHLGEPDEPAGPGDAETAGFGGEAGVDFGSEAGSGVDGGPDWPVEQPGEAGSGPPAFGGVDAHVDEPLAADGGDGADRGDGAGDPPEPVFGAPDPIGHDGWTEPQFPPALDLPGLPDPIDGPPWTDAALLGGTPVPEYAETGGVDPSGLLEYAGLDDPGADPWAALLASDDPATSALARWWGPADQ